MSRRTGLCVLAAALAALSLGVQAQTSPSYQNQEHVVNSGGNPAPALTSSNYQISLSAIGDGLSQSGMSSAGYTLDGGFTGAYPPPGEVLNLRFTAKTTLAWDPEPTVGTYNVYRGLVSGLSSGYGTCLAQGLTVTQATDEETPLSGQCYFYLITAENRLREEGTSGRNSAGTPHPNPSPCP